MCGICGIFGSSDYPLIEKMTLSISHRGPDASTCKIVRGRHALGGARLHITGEKDVPFPYFREKDGVHVLLNGEIYNYQYWREQLTGLGYTFTTGTDTEVVWALYHEYGPYFVEKLKGMFAIAILDGDKLILVRDRMGIKPLYYYQQSDKMAFASEIKAILRFAEKTPDLNIPVLQEILTFGYIYTQDETLFAGIKQVRPGETLIYDGRESQRYYYYQPTRAFSLDETPADYTTQKLLLSQLLPGCMDSILRQGEQEKGVFLSGGVDSSLMALLAKETTGHVTTFTLADSPDAPDLSWARKVATALRSDHHEFKVDINDYLSELPRFVYHYENIVAGGVFDLQGGIAFHLLCQRASQYVRVVLTGEGADELFGGYYWTYTHPLGFADRIRTRLKQATRNNHNARLNYYVEQLFPQPEEENLYRKNVFDALLKGGLSNYHLWSVDRSCGAFGFEIRPFYLHDDIVNLALNIPVDYKVAPSNVTKLILKDVASTYFARYGLEDVAIRQKFGMPSALNQLNVKFNELIGKYIRDDYYGSHPYSGFLTSKQDVFMFDLFYYIFFHNRGHFDPVFNLEEAVAGGIFENMYR